jgi:transposase
VRIEDERDIEQLRTKALVLARENERMSKKMLDLLRENLSLKGMSQEQLQATLKLIDDELNKTKSDAPAAASSTERRGRSATTEKKPQTGHGPREQPNLEIVPDVHDLDEADRACVECGGQLQLWEGQDDETEEVDVIERRFVMKKHIRKKYRCKCGCVEMADMPVRLVPGGRYSNEFAIEVAASKYVEHLPFERQVRAMEGQGLIIDSQTLWDQNLALAAVLKPAWLALREDALANDVIGFDETTWKLLEKGNKKAWTMWQLSTWRSVFFAIAPTKGSEDGDKFLAGFKGIAVGDAATTHQAMAKNADFKLAYCWAHARRAFIRAEGNDPIRSKQFIEMVAELYAIEDQAPAGPPGDELRRQLRNEKSRPIVERIKTWLTGQRFLPRSEIGTAMKYVAAHWDGLCVFLDEPAVPIDNNSVERGFRGPALGRNNFYGSHSRRGTEVAAIMYSLVESAKLNGVDPKRYLRRALTAALAGERIPLPHEIAATA